MADDLKLLQEALHAVRKGKLHVVIDHLERVIVAQRVCLMTTKSDIGPCHETIPGRGFDNVSFCTKPKGHKGPHGG
jgi:hypothetical protein